MICAMCKTIFHAGREVTRIQTGAQEPHSYRHYHSGEKLWSSVQAGCRICCMVWNRMAEDARLGVTNGYIDGWTHDVSMVGAIWYSILGDYLSDTVTLYFTYAFEPEQTPASIALAGMPDKMRGKTVALYAAPASSLPHQATMNSSSKSTGDDVTWELALRWLKTCINTHPKCSSRNSAILWQPKRLLDVDTGDANTIRLQINNESTTDQAYVSLSHCWGKIAIKRLLKSHLQEFQNGLQISKLPKTFQDAISVTRRLRIKFIWIDSLCIIQDSVEDWQQEAATMGDVYRNASLNIAATGSSDGNGGCFTERDATLVPRIEIESSWTWGPGQYQIYDSALWRHGVTCAPLNTRAWVVQERVLAKRVLHFGSNQIYWECDQRLACETFPEWLPDNLTNETPRFNSMKYTDGTGRLECFYAEWLGLLKPDPEHVHRFHDLWSNTVTAYTRCQLSHQTDKLIALSGLAKEIAGLINDEYLAGIWRRHLPYHLLWFLERPPTAWSPKDDQGFIAPSWSWASTIGQVTDHPISQIEGEEILIEILEAHTETVTPDKTGQCTSGLLKIRGMLKEAQWTWWDHGEMYTLMFDGVRAEFAIAFPDCVDFVSTEPIYCLPIHRFELGPDEPRLYGLVLSMVKGEGDVFKRLGQFKVDFDLCDGFEHALLMEQEFIII